MTLIPTTTRKRIKRPGLFQLLIYSCALALLLYAGVDALAVYLQNPPYAEVIPVIPPIKPTPGVLSGVRVCLDPGHGYDDSGAEAGTPEQLLEKDVTLSVALALGRLLEAADCSVTYTRASDEFVSEQPDGIRVLSQSQRVAMANQSGADLFLSLHCDSFPEDPAVNGTGLYYCENGAKYSDALCSALLHALSEELQRPVLPHADAAACAYLVNRDVTVPSVLVELGFLSNETDAALLADAAGQEALAHTLFLGICTFCREQALLKA